MDEKIFMVPFELNKFLNESKVEINIINYDNSGWLDFAAEIAKKKGNLKRAKIYNDLSYLLSVLEE